MLIVTSELILEPPPSGEHHLLSSPDVGPRHVCSGEGIPGLREQLTRVLALCCGQGSQQGVPVHG